ncbi:MAG: hypothetical protein ACPL8I_05545 [Chloroflexaceae bacterium]
MPAFVLMFAAISTTTRAQPPLQIYLPVMGMAARQSLFAVQSDPGFLSRPEIRARAADLGARWVRLDGFIWHEVQTQRGGPYNWQALRRVDDALASARDLGMTPVGIIRGAPEWAAVVPSNCAAIRDEYLGEFAAFLEALAWRYRGQVDHWEIGNEPDVDPGLVPSDSPYGCMGDVHDLYYGGERYGRMLQVATPALHRGNPEARIIFGGLLLSESDTSDASMGNPERFFEGALRAGGGAYFDILAYHTYPSYSGQPLLDHDIAVPGPWQHLGGWTVGKVNFLSEVMSRYGVRKPLWLNETSLICSSNSLYCATPDAAFFEAQAHHLVRTFARAAAADVSQVTWYTLEGPGWRWSSLLDGRQQPRPAYVAFRNMARMVEPFSEVRRVEYGVGVEAYRFVQGSKVVDVLWSQGGERRVVRVPFIRAIGARRLDGSSIAGQIVDTSIQWQVDFAPILIERRP